MNDWARLLSLPDTGTPVIAPHIIAHRLDAEGFTVTLDRSATGIPRLRRSTDLGSQSWSIVVDAQLSTVAGQPTLTDPHPPGAAAYYQVEWPTESATR
jgi:hypothetical protein